MQDISKHITYREATYSKTAEKLGIPNIPGNAEIKSMQLVAQTVFEPVRSYIDKPIKITSFFRSWALNRAIGGSASSQHVLGQAIDMEHTEGFTNLEIFNLIRQRGIFDQLIWEHGTDFEPDWVHVSYRPTNNRKQVLKAEKVNGKTKYFRI
ncbi:MAG TPA: D-Ala-D-Ala carboxypeptidase family metallohydrolase, partial [Bacteroidales bacterium]|nr:D-Ala-D-Ala carboxypeptidase family metallohydrolase [Bacteroidales bacterium]